MPPSQSMFVNVSLRKKTSRWFDYTLTKDSDPLDFGEAFVFSLPWPGEKPLREEMVCFGLVPIKAGEAQWQEWVSVARAGTSVRLLLHIWADEKQTDGGRQCTTGFLVSSVRSV